MWNVVPLIPAKAGIQTNLFDISKIRWVPASAGTSGSQNRLIEGHYAAIASSRRRVTAGPKPPITTNTTAMAPAMKLNTPTVP